MALSRISFPLEHLRCRKLSNNVYAYGTKVNKELHMALAPNNEVINQWLVKEVVLSPKNKLKQLGVDRFIYRKDRVDRAKMCAVDKDNMVLMTAYCDDGFKAMKDFIKKLKGI